MSFDRKVSKPRAQITQEVHVTKGDKGDRGEAGTRGAQGPPGPSGSSGASSDTIEIVSTEPVSAFAVVTSSGRNADSSSLASVGRVAGINLSAVGAGETMNVTNVGEVTNLGWAWTAGDVVFLNGTVLSTTVPGTGFIQRIGTARNSTTLIVELGEPILL